MKKYKYLRIRNDIVLRKRDPIHAVFFLLSDDERFLDRESRRLTKEMMMMIS